jgi:hypothetical protein
MWKLPILFYEKYCLFHFEACSRFRPLVMREVRKRNMLGSAGWDLLMSAEMSEMSE